MLSYAMSSFVLLGGEQAREECGEAGLCGEEVQKGSLQPLTRVVLVALSSRTPQ